MSETTMRSYRPGAWFGVFGAHATVLLPPTEKARVARLWELIDDEAGFDEVLDALISDGLRRLPGFVLVSQDGPDTKVVIRGSGHASLVADGESIELEGSPATTWVERTIAGVTSLSIKVGDESHDIDEREVDELVVRHGLVRVSRIDVPPPTQAGEPEPVSFPAPVSAPQSPDEQSPDEQPDDDEPDTASQSAVPDLGPATEAMPPPGAVAAGPATDSDHDGRTQAGRDHPPAYVPPGIPGQSPTPGIVSRPVARLVLSSGETVDVDRAVVIGRAPEARRLPAADQPRLVTVPSPQQEISSTHLEIRPGSGADHGSAVATDLGSTNGTVLVQPGLPPEDLQPGVAAQLIPGAIIDLGDGVTVQVIDP